MQIDVNSNELIAAATALPADSGVCILDSSGVGHLGSHQLIVGFEPIERLSFKTGDTDVLEKINAAANNKGLVAIFTLSYEFARQLQNFPAQDSISEPLVYAALFECVAIYDYLTGETRLCGNKAKFNETLEYISANKYSDQDLTQPRAASYISNFSKDSYIAAVLEIQEEIRKGNTYQTNLTQQIKVELGIGDTPQKIFKRLRYDHPAPFAAYIDRGSSVVVSASPERLVRSQGGVISASPIKGTRRRSSDIEQDSNLANELLTSKKDRAENTMIVDLLRNDLGRICQFGSVNVAKLCELESHPTLYHLVSTINGVLRDDVGFPEIIRAVFPSGSITGAPKISTMNIIDRIEQTPRGLSMGAIGILVPDDFNGLDPVLDINVAIRTMTISDNTAVFNVGGGIVIDSDPLLEYDEALLKASALLKALGANAAL